MPSPGESNDFLQLAVITPTEFPGSVKVKNGFQDGGQPDATSTSENTLTGTAVEEEESSENSGQEKLKSLLPFCISYGFGSMLSSTLSIYLSSQITTLEKVFGFSSLRSGILMSANDIGFLATVLFVSHFLKRFHIPRILAGCVVVFGLSGILTGLPQFIANIKMESGFVASTNTSNASRDISYLCVSRDLTENYTDHRCMASHGGKTTSSEDSDNSWVVSLIFFLLMIQGVCKAPRQALSTTYVDSNSERTNTGFYIGLIATFSLFGPMLALTSGGLFSKLPIDLRDTTLTPEDPRWLGAWWLGFFIFGGASVIVAIPLFFFKRGRSAPPDSKYSKENHDEDHDDRQSFFESLKDMPKSLWRVVSNPVYVLLCLGNLIQMWGIMPLIVFGPKYLETQFNIPSWKANIILGAEKIVTLVLGTFMGGVITRKFRLNVAGCLKLILVTRLVGACLSTLSFIFGCENPPIDGLRMQESPTMLSGYNGTCDCTHVQFLPMCVDGSQTYFSPCHAGCQAETEMGYMQCSASYTDDVKPGICNTGCPYLIPYVGASAVSSLIGTLAIASYYVISLRVVDEKDRALSIGFSSFATSLLVFLPGPIFAGKIIDATCLVWREKCGVPGSCAVYDIVDMRVMLMSLETGCRFASVLCTMLLFVYYRRISNKVDTVNEKTIEVGNDKNF